MMDVRMRAENFQIIDAKENLRSEAYGKAFVNFFGMMKGRLDNLQMRGRLDVLGSTDMTYILRDAPLTTDNRLNELVTFVNFSDSTKVQVSRPPINGVSMEIIRSIPLLMPSSRKIQKKKMTVMANPKNKGIAVLNDLIQNFFITTTPHLDILIS